MRSRLRSARSRWARSRASGLRGQGSGLAGGVLGCAAALALAASGASPAGGAPASARADAGSPPGLAGARARPVLLLNGDRAVIRPSRGGHAHAMLLPAPGGGIVFGLQAGGKALLIPAAALPYLGRGLAPGLFNVASLRRAESGGRLPVQVSYAGLQPKLPGVTITRSGGGRAAGYLTASSARVFYAALARQFRADHAQASYGRDGLFAGGVGISLPGAPDSRSGTSRPHRRFPMRTLTVTGTSLAGKPDTGDDVFVFNAADSSAFRDPSESESFFYHGVARFSVPAGTYWAFAWFVTNLTKTAETISVVVQPQFSVQGNQTRVHLAARAATSELGASTPRPSALRAWALTVTRNGPRGSPTSFSLLGYPPDNLRINPTSAKPSAGSLHVYDTQTLTSPAGAAGTPYVYNLALAGPAGIIPDLHATIAQRGLATVTERFYQDVASTGVTFTDSDWPQLLNSHDVAVPLRLPGLQTQYMSGNPSVAWQTSYDQFKSSFSGGQADAFRVLRPGQELTEAWNTYPLHPQPFVQLLRGSLGRGSPAQPSAFRMGDKLWLFTTAFSDNMPGHTGTGFFPPFSGPRVKVTGSYAVYQNGVRVAHGSPVTGDPFDGLPPVPLSHKPSAVRFVLSGARRGKSYKLSPAFRTVWAWRSRPEPGATLPPSWICTATSQRCAVQPMMTLDYDVHRMSVHGATAPGRQVIGLAVGHLQLGGHAAITGATVRASLDGGRTWRRATVTRAGAGRFTVSFTAPAGAEVTLRTQATDAAGGSIAETIQDAYRVS
jgi:hypothetical protein